MTVTRTPVPEEFRPEQPLMTDPQRKYLVDLINNREMSDRDRTRRLARVAEDAREPLTKEEASSVITMLKTLPKRSSQYARLKDEMPDVPEGRYAIIAQDEGESAKIKFYRVRHGKADSRWEGFQFLDAGRGGPHEDLAWTPIKDVSYKKLVLDTILADPADAAKRFGQAIGSCGVCGRTLTDETSRAYGIGPICRERTGW